MRKTCAARLVAFTMAVLGGIPEGVSAGEPESLPIVLALADGTNPAAVVELIRVPAGEFMMGAGPDDPRASPTEEFHHRVRITRPFYLGKTEITRRQWVAVMPQRGASATDTDECPVTGIVWIEATNFAALLTARSGDRLPPGMVFRLPTEAEWEYAARAGTTTPYCFGSDPALLGEYAWTRDNAKAPMPVGLKKPNAWGFHDMTGNVWEWCLDYFQPDHTTREAVTIDPVNVVSNYARVVRGGSYVHTDGPESIRISSQWGNMYHGKRRPHVGMRLAAGYPLPSDAAAEASAVKRTANPKGE